MKLKKGSIALLTLAGMFYMSVQKADACTRAVYIGPDHMVVTCLLYTSPSPRD